MNTSTNESLHQYIKYRLNELELYSRDLIDKAGALSGEEYRGTLGMIGDCSARKQELLLLERRFGGAK